MSVTEFAAHLIFATFGAFAVVYSALHWLEVVGAIRWAALVGGLL